MGRRRGPRRPHDDDDNDGGHRSERRAAGLPAPAGLAACLRRPCSTSEVEVAASASSVGVLGDSLVGVDAGGGCVGGVDSVLYRAITGRRGGRLEKNVSYLPISVHTYIAVDARMHHYVWIGTQQRDGRGVCK